MTDDRARPPASRPERRRLHGIAAIGLALGLLLEPGLVTARETIVSGPEAGPSTADPWGPNIPSPAAAAATSTAAGEPSEIALEAAAHANDRIAFIPGARVTVPFAPRADDGWAVDGLAPRSLPVGAATGRSMLTASQGSIWSPDSIAPQAQAPGTPADGLHPIDGPGGGLAVRAEPVSAMVVTNTPPAAPAATDLRRQVFGFLPYWKLGDSGTRLKYDLLSTIAYFGVGADAHGNLLKHNRDGSTSVGWAGWASSRMTAVIQAAHRRGTRVVLTVQAFAWTTNQANNQDALLGSPAARLTLARQIAAAVRDRGADGVNLDFEPLVSGRSAEFVALVRTIRAELARIARGYQVTFDTTGSIGNYPIETATGPGAADAIFIMGYDYRTASSPSAGSIAPLRGGGYDLIDTILAYTDRVPAGRLILGIPYYGRAWSTTSNALRARTQTGAKYGYSASLDYASAVTLAARYGRRYDAGEATAWFAYRRRNCTSAYGCVTSWREVYYDDARSLGAKYDTINRFGLRGAGIWALGYDNARPELYRTIVAKFLHDTTPPDTGISVLPPRVGDEGFIVRWSAQDMNAIRSYDVQYSVDRGPWHAWLTRTGATDAVLLGHQGHAYAFRARATDAKGNRGAWNVAALPNASPTLARGSFAIVRAATLTVRGRPTTGSGAVSQLHQGDNVAITGGPVQADGYTWYQIAGPLTSWAPVEPVRSGVWVAGGTASATYLSPRTPPNTTIVDAALRGLSFGAGGAGSLGPTPAARAARAFSPNGDGSEDRLGLRWTNGLALDALSLRVFRASGTVAGTLAVPDLAPGAQTWAWDGSVGGAPLPDGSYLLQLVGTAAGRTYSAPSARPITGAQLARYAVTIDTVGPRMTASSISGGLISPRVDGRHDTVSVLASSTGATRWRLTAAPIVGPAIGPAVRTIGGPGGAPRTSWNGRTDAGTAVPDGRYRLNVAVLDAAGNAASRSWVVVVDGTAPVVNGRAVPAAVSPNGDGIADATVLRWTTGERASASVAIYRGSKLVRTLGSRAPATSGALRWDGRGRAGATLPDGTYQARTTVEDAAGNRRTSSIAIRLDRTIGWLRWTPAAFYPQDLDSLARTATASFRLTRSATTTLQVLDSSGAVVRTAWSGRKQGVGAVHWIWDGRNTGAGMVAPGSYALVLTATGAYGTSQLRQVVTVDAFVVSISSTQLKAGQTLVVTFTTVEALSSRPVVTLDQTGLPPARVVATAIGPGRYRASLRVAAGGSGPAVVKITARDSGGRLNLTIRSIRVL